jgi:hypothetical protein
MVQLSELVEVFHADAGHPDHVQHDGAGIGQLDAGGELLQRRALRCHEVRHDVHGLAGRSAADEREVVLLGRAGWLPVVVDALVALVSGGDDGALLGARSVLDVGA